MVNSIDVLLRLLNQRRFAAGMATSAASVRGFKESVEDASSASSGLSRASFAAEGALYGVGMAARSGAAAVTAAMAAFTGLGVAFNSTLEQNTLAFEKFTGGVEQSKTFTKDLFEIASQTPFAFTDITTAARRFLAFGFSVQETTEMLEVMGDTLAYTGGGTDEILRMSKAFGDIRAKGKLMQQELMQLANLNIPFRDIMSLGGLELTEKQWNNVGRANISANRALEAFQKGLRSFYGGGAAKYMETFAGQWQRLKDNVSLAAGIATESTGVFGFMKGVLEDVNKWVEANGDTINKTYRTVGRIILGAVVGAFEFLKRVIKDVITAFKPMVPFFENVIFPMLKGLAAGLIPTLVGAWKILIGVVWLFSTALGTLGSFLEPLKPLAFGVGMALSFFGSWILKAINLVGKLGFVFSGLARVIKAMTWPLQQLAKAWGPVKSVAVAFFVGVGSIAEQFGEKIGGVFDWLGEKIKWLINKIKWVLEKAQPLKDAFEWVAPGGGGGIFGTGVGPNVNFPGDKIGLSTGGYISSGGMALVGERGPELVSLPTGSEVINNMATARVSRRNQLRTDLGSKPSFEKINIEVRSPIYVDRRQIGEAVGTYVAERKARR